MKPYRRCLTLTLVALFYWTGSAQNGTQVFSNLDVTGGNQTGHYEAQDTYCLYDHSWDIDHVADMANPPDSLTHLETLSLKIPDADNPEAFILIAGFGDYFSPYKGEYVEYGIAPANGFGTGSVQVDRDDTHALITVTGETAEGVQLTATFECVNYLDGTLYDDFLQSTE
jgi:hypothetical protein